MNKLIALFMVAALATNASAVDLWTNADLDNDFTNAANWTPSPTSGDDFFVVKDGTNKAILAVDSPWVIDDLYIGAYGNAGDLDITGGTHVINNRFRLVYGSTTPSSTLNISGSASVTAGVSYTTWGDTDTTGDATVSISDSASVTLDRITLGSNGSGTTTVTMSGSSSLTLTPMDPTPASTTGVFRFGDTTGGVYVTVSDSAIITAECMALGWHDFDGIRVNNNSPGLLTISDSAEVHLTGSTLAAYGDAIGAPYDEYLEDFPTILAYEDINGDDLGGRIVMDGGVFDLAGDQEALIEAMLRDTGDLTGSLFTDAYITNSDQYKGLVPVYDDYNTGYTRVVICSAGDANGDGLVNASDQDVLDANFGQSGDRIWMDADFNGDNAVDECDRDILMSNYGNSYAYYVPEPSTLVGLLVLCLAGLLGSTRRKC
ncbi:MAG: PEP-CTERM sorting domain-containing protein [Pirellulales bacterium]|nr:PEP-CTERM sorting domain-containing protein [Pirellulales bacterium]